MASTTTSSASERVISKVPRGVNLNKPLFAHDLQDLRVEDLTIGGEIILGAGTVGLTLTTTAASPAEVLRFITDRASANGDVQRLSFRAQDSDGIVSEYARLDVVLNDRTAGSFDSSFEFGIEVAGTMTTVLDINASAAGVVTSTVPSGDIILNDNVSLQLGTAGAESDLSSDGTNTIWNFASGNFTVQAAGATDLIFSANLLDVVAGTIVELNNQLRFDTGVAATAANYQILRNADATNLLQLNVPTGASFEFSVNDVVEATLSGTTFNLQANELTTTGNIGIGAAASATNKITSALGTITALAEAFTATGTWNNAAVTFDLISGAITDTASAAVSRLINLSVGGTSQFAVTKAGAITSAGSYTGTVLNATAATNQVVLDSDAATTTTITAPAPAASRIVTLPDGGAASSFVLTESAQTINGVKTFGNQIVVDELTNQIVTGNGVNLTTSSYPASAGAVTLTFPNTADTIVGRATTDVLTNKSVSLATNTVTGTTAQFNTALTDNDFATLAGVETLTNKTLTGALLSLNDSDSLFNLTITSTSTLLADQTLTIDTEAGSRTLRLAGDFITSGTFATTITVTGATGVTLPTSGTLYGTLAGSITSAQLLASMTDESGTGALVFANTPTLVTPLLGTPTSGVLTNCTGLPIVAGTTGTLSVARGGTGLTTIAANQIVYASALDTIAGLATAASSVLVTSAGSVPSMATDIPTAVTIGTAYIYRVGGTDISLADGGTAASLVASNGAITYSGAAALALSAVGASGQLLRSAGAGAPTWTTSTYPVTNAINTLVYASAADTLAALPTANSSVLVTSATGVPSLSGTLPQNGSTIQAISLDAATTIAVTSNVVELTTVGAETLTTITGGIAGQLLTIIFLDSNCTLTDTGAGGAANTIALSAALTGANNTTLTLVRATTQWLEVGRAVNA